MQLSPNFFARGSAAAFVVEHVQEGGRHFPVVWGADKECSSVPSVAARQQVDAPHPQKRGQPPGGVLVRQDPKQSPVYADLFLVWHGVSLLRHPHGCLRLVRTICASKYSNFRTVAITSVSCSTISSTGWASRDSSFGLVLISSVITGSFSGCTSG